MKNHHQKMELKMTMNKKTTMKMDQPTMQHGFLPKSNKNYFFAQPPRHRCRSHYC